MKYFAVGKIWNLPSADEIRILRMKYLPSENVNVSLRDKIVKRRRQPSASPTVYFLIWIAICDCINWKYYFHELRLLPRVGIRFADFLNRSAQPTPSWAARPNSWQGQFMTIYCQFMQMKSAIHNKNDDLPSRSSFLYKVSYLYIFFLARAASLFLRRLTLGLS